MRAELISCRGIGHSSILKGIKNDIRTWRCTERDAHAPYGRAVLFSGESALSLKILGVFASTCRDGAAHHASEVSESGTAPEEVGSTGWTGDSRGQIKKNPALGMAKPQGISLWSR